MNTGENWNAAEAMLHLSRPEDKAVNAQGMSFNDSTHAVPPFVPSAPSQTVSIPRTAGDYAYDGSSRSYFDEHKTSDVTSGSSLSPSLSPLRERKSREATPDAEQSRPLAMRLSQLVTPESVQQPLPLLPSPLRLKASQELHLNTKSTLPLKPTALPLKSSSLHLRSFPRSEPARVHFPPLKLAMHSAPMPLTEPVTPPFSPPVLPPLACVTGLPPRPGAGGMLAEKRNVTLSSWTGYGVSSNTGNMGAANTSMSVQDIARSGNSMQQAVVSSSLYSTPRIGQLGAGAQALPSTNAASVYHGSSVGGAAGAYYNGTGGRREQTTRSTNSGIRRGMKRPYKKYYSNPTPSSHCHVCARTSKAVKFAVCARIAEGLCRKVTCYKCFMKFGWDWEGAVDNPEWVCVHCRGECPEGRSQCFIYSRVNSKRESKRGAKKAAKLAAAAAAAAAVAAAAGKGAGGVGSGQGQEGMGRGLPSVRAVFGTGEVRQRVW